MRSKLWILSYLVVAICCFYADIVECDNKVSSKEAGTKSGNYKRTSEIIYSPLVDHNNEWIPVGRGNPLRNDPTYDYSPPVLDRVKYWADTTSSGNTSKDKKDVLVLGVTTKKQTNPKESKYGNIRRNYFTNHIPTRLMPPPMQTKPVDSSFGQYHPSKAYHSGMTWTMNKNKYYPEPNIEETMHVSTVIRPSSPAIATTTTMRLRPNMNEIRVGMSRKPWIQDLLQKEVVKTTPKPTLDTEYPMEKVTTLEPQTTTPVYFTTLAPEKMSITEYFFPTVAAAVEEPETPKKQSSKYIQSPMYMIIEGHSKVKKYGLGPNDIKSIFPKIVPVVPTKDTIVRHVVSNDEFGNTLAVQHLHPRTTTTTTVKPILSSTQVTKLDLKKKEPSTMDSLLSFLDTSLGNFFLNGVKEDNSTTIATTTTHTTATTQNFTQISIKTTTMAPTVKHMIKDEDLTTELPRERRQIFDYDQLPDPSELTDRVDESEYEYDEDSSLEVENSNKDSEADGDGLKNPNSKFLGIYNEEVEED
ncbi:hypothetical protein ACFFRR_004749 [Megaselia abdita]